MRRTLLYTGTDGIEYATPVGEIAEITKPATGEPVVALKNGKVRPVSTPSYTELVTRFDDLADGIYLAP
jgi:hypothetical protein